MQEAEFQDQAATIHQGHRTAPEDGRKEKAKGKNRCLPFNNHPPKILKLKKEHEVIAFDSPLWNSLKQMLYPSSSAY